MKYKAGDKVRVREDLKVGKFYGDKYFNSHMAEFAGQTVTIIYKGSAYYIKEAAEKWVWTDEMFSGLAEPRNLIPQKPKLTEDERVILENLPKKYKYIARDPNGLLYIYGNKPTKDSGGWFNGMNDNLSLFKHLFQFIKQEDREPYNIEELLKGE